MGNISEKTVATGFGGLIGGMLGSVVPVIGTQLGATAGAWLGSSLGGDDDISPPDPITEAPNSLTSDSNEKALVPVSYAQIFDEISGDKTQIIRRGDRFDLKMIDGSLVDLSNPFSEYSTDIQYYQPKQVQAKKFNPNLPALNKMTKKAVSVTILSQKMRELGDAIEKMENTSPFLIKQNKQIIDAYKDASYRALKQGFDIKRDSLSARLKKAGLLNSSSSFAMQVALVNQEAQAYSDVALKTANLATDLKERALNNLHKRGDFMGKEAHVELSRFEKESMAEARENQLIQDKALREKNLALAQDQHRIDTELKNENLRLKAAEDHNRGQALELQAAQMNRNTDLAYKDRLIARNTNRKNNMLNAATNLYNTGTNQAIQARQVDNNMTSSLNNYSLKQYELDANPWEEARHSLIGAGTDRLAESFLGIKKDKKKDK